MSIPRIFIGLCAVVVAVGRLPAQDAQQIINEAAKVYAGATSYSADVDSRTVYLRYPPSSEADATAYRVVNTQYRRLQLKVRRPYDYLLGTQSYSDLVSSGGGVPQPNMGSAPWAFLSRTESSLPKQGISIGGRFSIQSVPAEQFTALVNSRVVGTNRDIVLSHFKAQADEVPADAGLGLIEPDVIGQETRNGKEVYRLVAKTRVGGRLVMIWIEKESHLIVRTILQRSRAPGPLSTPVPPSASRAVAVVETFYNNQRINPPLASADFAIKEGAPSDRKSAEELGFSSVADLVKLAEVTPGKDGEIEGIEGSGTDHAGEEGAEKTTTPAPVANDGQALSYEQMSGIVLIDGDGGTATGFMTKIRDVDFIVTNLHVLVGNKKLTIKTLNGEEITPMDIFGAVGGDIAIIRVGKGQGDLKLATDVFKTSKIGDKVVVVGNRRGGGVATQTAGSIKGIGPKLVEVDANFQPGNSGSPIVNLSNNEVIGVATFASTRRVDLETGGASARGSSSSASEPEIEKRWFGYRLDGVTKWEVIDLAKWNDQANRLTKFRENSEALHAVIRFDLKSARQNPRLTSIIDNFDSRYRASSGNSSAAAGELKDLFRVIRSISDDGVGDLTSGDYYDYYRTCKYWENSIPGQLEYRKAIVEVLKRYENNPSLYLSRTRGN